MSDYSADVAKHTSNVDEAAVKAVVEYCYLLAEAAGTLGKLS